MPYTKNTWACGDGITAEKLNHMEGGDMVANIISRTGQTAYTIDANCSDIIAYLESGKTNVRLIDMGSEDHWVLYPYYYILSGTKSVRFFGFNISPLTVDDVSVAALRIINVCVSENGGNTINMDVKNIPLS